MKNVIRAVIWFFGAVVVSVAALIGWSRFTYDREYDALKAAIQARPGFTIVDEWRHEDITLEDFGFCVQSKTGTFWIEIADGTRVRMPRDRIVGIELRLENVPGRRAVSFDSPYWRDSGLRVVATADEFLEKADVIIPGLARNPPPISNLSSGPFAEYSMYLRIRLPKSD